MTKVKTLCWECTGDGRMLGFYPCKVCGATGYIETEVVNSAHGYAEGSDLPEEPVRTGVETSEAEEYDPDFLGEQPPWNVDMLPPTPPQHYIRSRLPRIEEYKP